MFDVISSKDASPIWGIFLCIPVSDDDAAALYLNGIKTLVANGLSTFFIKGKPAFSTGPRSLTRNPADCTILDSWVFNNFILGHEFFPKLCGKLVSSLESPITFDERFKVSSATFLIPDFDLLSCELGNFTFKLLYSVTVY